MTTDMSERERMNEVAKCISRRDRYMERARGFMMCPVVGGDHIRYTRRYVYEAREANRQAVRLWWRR